MFSIITDQLRRLIKIDFEKTVMEISPFIVNKLMNTNMNGIKGWKKAIFRGFRSPAISMKGLSKGTITDAKGRFTLIYQPDKNQPIDILSLLDVLKENKGEGGFHADENMSYSDLAFEINYGSKQRTLSIANLKVLGTNMDITDKVELGNDGYPTFATLEKEANVLLSYIKE